MRAPVAGIPDRQQHPDRIAGIAVDDELAAIVVPEPVTKALR
jgi:hypothetical protein